MTVVTSELDSVVADLGLPAHWAWQIEVRPRRRTLGLEVHADGSIVVAVPPNAIPGEVADVLRMKMPWLGRAVWRSAKLHAEQPAKDIVDGEGFAYLGRSHRLLLVDDQQEPVRLNAGWLRIPRPASAEIGAGMIIDWYRRAGRRWLVRRVSEWTGRLGVPVPAVIVRDLGTCWGQRQEDGSVVFHWATMQMPARLIDLVVVHELVHLLVPRHDADFRRRVRLALPDIRELEADLAQVGRQVWMGALRDGV